MRGLAVALLVIALVLLGLVAFVLVYGGAGVSVGFEGGVKGELEVQLLDENGEVVQVGEPANPLAFFDPREGVRVTTLRALVNVVVEAKYPEKSSGTASMEITVKVYRYLGGNTIFLRSKEYTATESFTLTQTSDKTKYVGTPNTSTR